MNARRFCLLLASWLLSASAAQALLLVNATVTPLGGSFHYEVTIENTGPDDYVLVSITDAPLGDPLVDSTLTSPPGFLASYDAGLGFVDFLADADLFAAGLTVSGFSFHSVASPPLNFTMFEALDEVLGSTTGSIAIELVPGDGVPDAGGTALATSLGLLGLGLIGWTRRGTSDTAHATPVP